MKLAALKIIYFLFMGLAFTGESLAANWVKLSENGTSKLLIDKQSILEKDQLTRAWVKVEYKKAQINSESADKAYNLSKLLWYFDCPAQKSATTQVFQYMNAETVFSAGIDVKAAEFIEPVPETDLDRAMRYVCSRAQPKNQHETKLANKPSENKSQTPITKENATAEAEKKPAPAAEPAATEAKPVESKPVEAKPEAVKADPEKTTVIKPSKGKAYAAHWTYEGKEGPEYWGKLQPEFATCDIGQNQSPVNIDATIDAPLKTLKGIQKMPAKEIVNNGHTIQANFKEGNMLLLDDTPFQMKQVHFHTPSE
ncbi:MAG TPA: carbonic anhydrase family protein, partial [Methylophilaceae bacterium]|nr:carbonic anhydrase family protein [Methylophilaceae bacterium]